MSSSSGKAIPPFKSLPLHPDHPRFSAWALYGADDELGTLNRLTSSTILSEPKSEILTGDRSSLNLPFDALGKNTLIGRAPFHIHQWNKAPRIVSDDVWTLNSQSSSQWDDLRHFARQKDQKFFNGVNPDDILSTNSGGTQTLESTVNVIDKFAGKGVVGRAVLVDYERWCRHFNVQFNPVPSESHQPMSIPLRHLKATLEYQETEIKHGDILVLRVGLTKYHAMLSEDGKETLSHTTRVGGVEQTEETLAWLWENFSAVATDTIAFEVWPSKKEWYMHEVLLAGWGMPIGELWDLEKLAKMCEEKGRWSFVLCSEVSGPPSWTDCWNWVLMGGDEAM